MSDIFDDLLAGISNPAITAEALNFTRLAMSPVDLALPLKDYQQEAVDHVFRDTVHNPYAMVGLDMGLGKTPVAFVIGATVASVQQTPTLFVVPPSLRTTMMREAQKFAPWLRVGVIYGAEPSEGDEIPDDADMLIIGDSSVKGWADFLVGKIAHLVVDESHRFKNKSNRSKGLVQIAESVPGMRVVMTGTPLPNGRHQELGNQVDVMGPDAWKDIGGKGIFWNHYARKADRFGNRESHDPEGLHEAMASSWFFRRIKEGTDALNIDKYREAVHLEGRGRVVKEYIKVEDDLIEWLQSKNGKVTEGQMRAEALIRMTTLRKLAGECKVKAAAERINEILEDNEEDGIFVVAEHADVIDQLMMHLAKYNPTTVRGGMSDDDKQNEMDLFNSGESRVLVGQIAAAGVGLTLHGDGRNRRVFVVQLPWTPADLKQAEDRLFRIGQTRDVLVEVAVCAIEGRWTIDERLWGMLEEKNFGSTTVTDGVGSCLIGDMVSGVLDSYR